MAKRSDFERYGQRVEVKEEPVKKTVSRATKEETVRLVLLKNLKLKVKGPVTKKEYFFPGGGSELNVDEKDVPGLLAKGLNAKSCCGGARGTPYFQLVE